MGSFQKGSETRDVRHRTFGYPGVTLVGNDGQDFTVIGGTLLTVAWQKEPSFQRQISEVPEVFRETRGANFRRQSMALSARR